jgi:hypothetical protein
MEKSRPPQQRKCAHGPHSPIDLKLQYHRSACQPVHGRNSARLDSTRLSTRLDSTHGEGGDVRVEDKGPEQVEPVSHGEGHDGLDARHAVLDGYDGSGGDDHAGLKR